MRTATRLYVRGVGAVLALLVSMVLSFGACAPAKHQRFLPQAVEALQGIDLQTVQPITQAILAQNHLRERAGVALVGEDWRSAQFRVRLTHFPDGVILLDAADTPRKVVLIDRWPTGEDCTREYDVVDGQLSGNAATWLGTTLFTVEAYQHNRLNGMTSYYAKTGERIGVCEFVDDEPWTGRRLDRDDFKRIVWDVSYRQGKLHGEERRFNPDGMLQHLNTFKAGVPDGLQRQYHEGRLRGEEFIERGRRRYVKSWHQNGQLQSEVHYSGNGKLDGTSRRWDEAGELVAEEHFSP